MVKRVMLRWGLAALVAGQVGAGLLVAPLALSQTPVLADPPGHTVLVGPGFTDVSPHELVRTAANILYTIVPDCPAYPCAGVPPDYTGPPNALHVYRASAPGTPTAFTEVDATHHPTGNIATAAAAIDGSNIIHVAWLTTNGGGNVFYAPFDTTNDTWGAATAIATTNWVSAGQGNEGVALALDSAGTPHALWSAQDAGGTLHVWYANKATNWAPQQVDDVALSNNRRAMHPTLAFEANNDLLVAWLEGTFNYHPDGIIHLRTRLSTGAWTATETINDTAMTTIDNGPSLLVTSDGTAHLTFLNAGTAVDGSGTAGDYIHYYYNNGGGWIANHPGGGLQISHDPSLGPGPNGTVRIYGHGWQGGAIDGHGDNLYSFEGSGGAGAWGPWTLYATGSFDSSVSTRWAQFFHPFPATLDVAYWADPYPNVLSVGSDIAAAAPAAHLILTGFPSPTPAGAPQPFSLTAQDATANIATTYTGTVHFTSSDPRAALPIDYTFTAADHGTHAFSATLNTAGAQSLTAADTAAPAITGSQSGIAVNPVLTGVSPPSGPVGGGVRVTLTGAGFTNGASVIFDTATAANVQVINSTTITATTPPHMAGAVNVKVAIAGSTTAILPGAYTYGDPPNPLPIVQPTAPPAGTTKAAPLPSLRPSAPTNLVSTPNPLPPPR
jgi:hypothetical protein